MRSRYYGKNPLCPTGPVLFGKAVASNCEPEDLVVGESEWIPPHPELSEVISERSHGFVFKDKLVALRRKRGGGPLSEIGINGGNNYNEFWNSQDVYVIS